MKILIKSFSQFLKEIWEDSMLIASLFAPILAGFFLKFALPQIEIYIGQKYGILNVLQPYYLLIDGFLAALTPLMFSFVGAMVILGEIDNNLCSYLSVTPLGKRGYLFSRLGLPTVLAIIYGSIITFIFSLSGITVLNSIVYSLLLGITSITITMIIVSVSSNKVEGMALAKLSSILLIGIPMPFFVDDVIVQYLAFFLPSFWVGKMIFHQSYIFILPFIVVSAVSILLLNRRFISKIT